MGIEGRGDSQSLSLRPEPKVNTRPGKIVIEKRIKTDTTPLSLFSKTPCLRPNPKNTDTPPTRSLPPRGLTVPCKELSYYIEVLVLLKNSILSEPYGQGRNHLV